MSVNAHMLFLYWEIGTYVAERQRVAGWGAKVIKTLSKDIRSAMPEARGFSARNILYMVQFAETYPLIQTDDSIAQPVAAQLDQSEKFTQSEEQDTIAQAVLAQIEEQEEIDGENDTQKGKMSIAHSLNAQIQGKSAIAQAVPAQLGNDDIMTQFLNSDISKVGWTHHVTLIDKVSDNNARWYYMQRTIHEGWSYRVLVHKIAEGLYESQGSLPNNFDSTLPPAQSELAKSILKDPYIFGFLNIQEAAKERELEMALLKDITKFLLELGKGFALMGQQYHMAVGGQDYYLDLLFYHTQLRCYFIIELKIDEFKPEYAGKLNFYVNAADDLIKTDHDEPTIGLLLCKSANKVVAEYTLKDMTKPIGIATYNLLPKKEDLIQLLQSKEIES